MPVVGALVAVGAGEAGTDDAGQLRDHRRAVRAARRRRDRGWLPRVLRLRARRRRPRHPDDRRGRGGEVIRVSGRVPSGPPLHLDTDGDPQPARRGQRRAARAAEPARRRAHAVRSRRARAARHRAARHQGLPRRHRGPAALSLRRHRVVPADRRRRRAVARARRRERALRPRPRRRRGRHLAHRAQRSLARRRRGQPDPRGRARRGPGPAARQLADRRAALVLRRDRATPRTSISRSRRATGRAAALGVRRRPVDGDPVRLRRQAAPAPRPERSQRAAASTPATSRASSTRRGSRGSACAIKRGARRDVR